MDHPPGLEVSIWTKGSVTESMNHELINGPCTQNMGVFPTFFTQCSEWRVESKMSCSQVWEVDRQLAEGRTGDYN